MEKRSIVIKKLFIDCFRFWYVVALFCVVGAAIGYLGGRKMNQKLDDDYQKAVEQQKKDEEERLKLGEDDVKETTYTKADCEEKLTPDSKAGVRNAYTWYLERNNRQTLMDNSILYNLDPYNYTTVNMRFRITEEDAGNNTIKLNSYVHELLNYVTYDGLAKELFSADNERLKEFRDLISISDGGKDQYDEVLVLSIVETDETKESIDKASSAFINYGRKLNQYYPGYSVELLSTDRTTRYNASLASAIETQRVALINDQSRIDNMTKKFSTLQTAYFQMLVNGKEEATVSEVVLQGQTIKKKAVEEIEKPVKHRLILFAFLGAAAGGIICLLILFFKNILSGKLLYVKDIKEMLGLRFCGTIREKKKNGIPGMLQRAEYPMAEEAENPNFLYLQIREMLKDEGCDNAVIVGTLNISELTGVEKMVELAKKDGIELSTESGFPKDLSSAEKVLKAKHILLVEEFHRSRLSEIGKIVDFCKDNNVNIHGVIGIDGV